MRHAQHHIANPAEILAQTSRTIGDMFLTRVQKSAERPVWQQKKAGTWQVTTWQNFYDMSAAVASALMAKGLQAGEKICIIGSTRPEWCVADIGGLLAGAVTVGAYPTSSPAQLAYVIDHSDSRFVIVEGAADVDKIWAIRNDIPKVERIYVWDYTSVPQDKLDQSWLGDWRELLDAQLDAAAITARQAQIKPDDTALIVYTSGTTGPPKGAMISHKNVLSMLASAQQITPAAADDLGMSFLPMAHVAERVMAFYGRISLGTSTAYATSIAHVLTEVVEVRPSIFGSVPRIFEKAYAKIMSGVAELPPGKQKIFRWAERVGRQMVADWQAGRSSSLGLRLQYALADKLIFSKIRAAFGGRVRQFVTGAAPIAHDILTFFWAAGLPIYEVYGQTEATTMTHANRPGAIRLGSVGKPVANIEVKLADDGEILVRGDLVFQGYYKNPQATAETISADGWLHTGDIGRVDADGFYYIIDRKKHIIITSGGKNLTPSNIENEIKTQDPLISQIHVHGDRRPYVSALVTIAPAEAIEYAKKHNLLPAGADPDAMVAALLQNPLAQPPGLAELLKTVSSNSAVQNRIVAAVAKGNQNLSNVERVKRIKILERDFSVEQDELTPTLKVKRKNVEQKYAAIFDQIYDQLGFALEVEGGKSD